MADFIATQSGDGAMGSLDVDRTIYPATSGGNGGQYVPAGSPRHAGRGEAPVAALIAAADRRLEHHRDAAGGEHRRIKDCDGNRVELWQPLEAPET